MQQGKGSCLPHPSRLAPGFLTGHQAAPEMRSARPTGIAFKYLVLPDQFDLPSQMGVGLLGVPIEPH